VPDDVHDSFWDRRQFAELSAREAAYRQRLSHEHTLNEKLRACSEALQRVLHDRPPSEGNLLETLHAIALLTGQTLEVGRTSVWIADARREHLRCRILLVDGVQEPSDHLVLPFADCVKYREALLRDDPVAVTDALNDPRTAELREYVLEHNIGALLDIAVVARNESIGVVCLEHIGEPRTWWPAEIAFASHLGSLVALGVEAERRVRAEYQAKEAEARYRHLVESLPVVVYSMDPDRRRLRYLSPRANELATFSNEEWMQMGPDAWLSRIVEEDRPRVIARHGKDRGVWNELVYRVRLEGRGICWVRDTSMLIRDAHGEPMAVQGILADITAQREAELAREEGERRARSLIRNMAMVAVRVDAHGKLAEVNPYFTKVTGYEPSEVLGTSWFQYIASKEDAARVRQSYDAALRVGSIAPRAEYGILTKAGEARRLLWTRTVLKDTAGRNKGIITLGMDLTDRMRLEAEIAQQAKVESLGHLASAVAHDFNNLLTVILNQSAMLSRMAQGERAQRAKASLDAALAQATALTHSLLVYARKNPEQRLLTDVDDLLLELGPLVHAMASKQLQIVTDLQAEASHVLMDRTRLRQLVLNLVGNASQATVGFGSSIRLSTHVEFVGRERAAPEHASQGEYVVLSVEDDGRGMDATVMDKMFEPFFTTKDAGQGTGLGLAICQSIVSEVGGFIEAKSEPGRGTRISIFLPRKEAAMGARRAPLTSEVVRAPRVLLVFGPTLDRDLAVSVREAGYAVALASNTKEATAHLANASQDVLVVDAGLRQACASVPGSARALNPELRVLLVGAGELAREPTLVVAGHPDNGSDFDIILRQPVTGPALIAAIDEALQTDEPRQSSSA
jgi:PAS domain S-box-containing protein